MGPLVGQDLSGPALLDHAIAFHDPNNHWREFEGEFKVTMKTPNSSNRTSNIKLNNRQQTFTLNVEKDNDAYTYVLNKNACEIILNGSTTITEEDRTKFKLSCERGSMMKNYYTYLYGLPMKLKDPGTIIDPKVLKKTFKNKEYLVLKASYKAEVGEDIWYFYFDPLTYAMEVYQFYHDEAKNDGEYILLSGLEEINGIKMPKTRAWYYNKDNTYLGTDILTLK
jgi:hypothetical protein